ncbi:MAG: OmpP1/FadL family transporter [Deltaproteobacteria bacterium]|nr:OmpP1/FadL family transporter [Deltaproteobacteria bacterium]
MTAIFRRTAWVLFFALVIPASVQEIHASGFGIFTQSASSLGQGAAVVSHTESPSAIFFNPALMNNLDGTQVEIGTTLLFPSREFKSSSTGQSVEGKDRVFYPSTFYATHKFNNRISAGVGVFSPFGLGSDWGDTWEGRYIATNSEMTTFDINPAVSFRLTPKISLAAGIDILLLDTTFEGKLNLGVDIGQKFKGDGTGYGYNLGLLYDITKNIAFGASYRSEIKVDITGQGTFDRQIPGLLVNSEGKTDLTLPQQLFAGISYKGFNPLTLEAGMRWEDWSSFKQLKVVFANGLQSLQVRNWSDTYAFNFGAQYRLNDSVVLRAGYLYGQNPVPDSTFDPTIPDSNTHLFCVGTGLNFGEFTMDLAYAYQLQADRTKNNAVGAPTPANGEYSTDIHIVAASLKYRF